MLTLAKDSPFVKYAYLLSDRYKKTGPPDRVSLCVLFWRSMLPTVLIIMPVLMLGFAGYAQGITPPRPSTPRALDTAAAIHLLIIVAAILAGSVVIATVFHIKDHPDSWLGTLFWAIKHRVCPFIELTAPVAVEAPESDAPLLHALRNAGYLATAVGGHPRGAYSVTLKTINVGIDAGRLNRTLKRAGLNTAWKVEAAYDPDDNVAVGYLSRRTTEATA